MKVRKYTLPRHTNLASQGSRTGAFLIDIALCFALGLAFFFGCFRLILGDKVEKYQSQIEAQQLESHLFYKNEKGEIDYYDDKTSFEEFNENLCYFYTVYLPVTSVDADKPVKTSDGDKAKSEYFTVDWYNKNILKIDTDGKTMFEYNSDPTKPGVKKEGASDENINIFMQEAWIRAAKSDFNTLPTIDNLSNKQGFYVHLEIALSGIVAGVITYLVIPYFLKDGRTVGKLSFGLCLADSDGYKLDKGHLLMRFVPLLVMLLALLIPIWTDLIYIVIVYLTVFLVSFCICMASPKKASLHDFCARTIVVDQRTSILFSTPQEEEMYIANEDNIDLNEVYAGEEPDISYEK